MIENPYDPRQKSCLYCFNLKLHKALARCGPGGWARIFYLKFRNQTLDVEFRDKAKSCEHFDCEPGEVWREVVRKKKSSKIKELSQLS